jgi:hypothetical protein
MDLNHVGSDVGAMLKRRDQALSRSHMSSEAHLGTVATPS